jgi:hypothetical protein
MEHNAQSFNKTFQTIQSQTKINKVKILEKYKIFPKRKVRMNIPLCCMVLVPIVCSTFKIYNLKMENVFQMGYKEGDKIFYLSLTNWKGEENSIDEDESS